MICIARRKDPLDELTNSIRDEGGEAAWVAADLANLNELSATASSCMDVYTPIHGIVNAAGINLRQSIEDITIDSWQATLNINLAAPFFFSREFIPLMKEEGYGRIINIASLQSVRAFPNGLAYGASKGGVCQLTRAMAEAWSRHGITCNALAPGFFPTELTEAVFSNPATRQWASDQTLIGRNGKLSDLAGALIFLASNASAYITGQTLFVDGGFTAK